MNGFGGMGWGTGLPGLIVLTMLALENAALLKYLTQVTSVYGSSGRHSNIRPSRLRLAQGRIARTGATL